MADTQMQVRTAELFENPNVALVVVANAKDRCIVFKATPPAGVAGAAPAPPQATVDAYVSMAATAAAAFDGDGDDGWVVARFRSRAWDVVAYRSAATDVDGPVGHMVMVSFVRP